MLVFIVTRSTSVIIGTCVCVCAASLWESGKLNRAVGSEVAQRTNKSGFRMKPLARGRAL